MNRHYSSIYSPLSLLYYSLLRTAPFFFNVFTCLSSQRVARLWARVKVNARGRRRRSATHVAPAISGAGPHMMEILGQKRWRKENVAWQHFTTKRINLEYENKTKNCGGRRKKKISISPLGSDAFVMCRGRAERERLVGAHRISCREQETRNRHSSNNKSQWWKRWKEMGKKEEESTLVRTSCVRYVFSLSLLGLELQYTTSRMNPNYTRGWPILSHCNMLQLRSLRATGETKAPECCIISMASISPDFPPHAKSPTHPPRE